MSCMNINIIELLTYVEQYIYKNTIFAYVYI